MKNEKIKTKYFDIIFSIGQNCLVPRILRKLNLRVFATPFDWALVHNYTISINLLKNKFENYYNKEDLTYICANDEFYTDVYLNKRTKTYFIHDFKKNSQNDFDAGYKISKEKYERRKKRLLKKLEHGAKVCLIFVECQADADKNELISNDIIKNDIKELNTIYKQCNFDIFYVKHNESLNINEYTINDRICELNNIPTNDKLGNINLVTKVLSQRIKLKILSKLSTYLYKIKRIIKLYKIFNWFT